MHVNTLLAFSLLVALFVSGAWDVYAYGYLSPAATVSSVVHGWSREFPILSVAVGILIGHLFWPVRRGV